MDFYLILQEIMDEKGVNIPAVARMCGLSDGTVRSIFVRKQKNVALEVAFKLSRGLNVSLERLNGLPEKEKEAPDTVEAAPREAEDETYARALKLYKALVSAGFLREGEDLTPEQIDILDGLSAIIAATFN